MLISDWSSDVCSSDLLPSSASGRSGYEGCQVFALFGRPRRNPEGPQRLPGAHDELDTAAGEAVPDSDRIAALERGEFRAPRRQLGRWFSVRSEEHTSELQSLMRISYAVFCLKKKKQNKKA